jgi:hypothetical protein
MSQDLYRKEALEHRSRALFGEVILRGPVSTWIVTAILVALMVVIIAGLFLFEVQSENGAISVFQWILSQGRN